MTQEHTRRDLLLLGEEAFASQLRVVNKMLNILIEREFEEIRAGVAQGLLSSQEAISDGHDLLDKIVR